jgi:hypothetical protein
MEIVPPDCGGRDLTKMFHVKYFGPVDGLCKSIFAGLGAV